ncbi:MAG TPA: hypothetical protein VHB21_11370 [Minicystis sp.]|nr:hypothetical protein [Minicystis sp.]
MLDAIAAAAARAGGALPVDEAVEMAHVLYDDDLGGKLRLNVEVLAALGGLDVDAQAIRLPAASDPQSDPEASGPASVAANDTDAETPACAGPIASPAASERYILDSPPPPNVHRSPRPPDERERRMAVALRHELVGLVSDELESDELRRHVELRSERDPRALYRLSLVPHPDEEPYLADRVRQLDSFLRRELGSRGAIYIPDVTKAGRLHHYVFALLDDRPGVATRIVDEWCRLASAARPAKVAHVARRVTGWDRVVDAGCVGVDVSAYGRRGPWHETQLRGAVDYACKPWKAPACDGRTARDLDDVIATGAFASAWSRVRATVEREMGLAADGRLGVPPALRVTSSTHSLDASLDSMHSQRAQATRSA